MHLSWFPGVQCMAFQWNSVLHISCSFQSNQYLFINISVMVSHIFTSSHNSLFFHPQVYPYLVVNDACLTESRREERVLQLLRMMNHFLTKQKETLRRLLYFTVPRVVAISPQMRLVEDNPASVSLLDVYKQVSNHNFPLTSPPPPLWKFQI